MEWLSHLTVPKAAAAVAIIVLTRIAWQVSSALRRSLIEKVPAPDQPLPR
jgi:hypothetical protein